MIVKTLGRKGSFAVAKSLAYVSNKDKVMRNPDGSPVVFTHNVLGKSLSEVEREFLENEEKRLRRRIDSNKLLHTILAFSPADNENLDAEKLERLTREYFQMLNPDALFYATVHQDKDNFHVHVVVSGNDMLGNSTRISKESFEKLKSDLQEVQQHLYPELEASVVEHGAEEKEFTKPDYWQKDEKISRKEELRETLSASFDLAQNREEFFELLKQDGLTTYQRGGAEVGVSDERNFRFQKTLGFDLAELSQREERLDELQELTESKDLEGNIEEDKTVEELSEEDKRMKELDELSER